MTTSEARAGETRAETGSAGVNPDLGKGSNVQASIYVPGLVDAAVEAFDPTVVPFRNKAGHFVVDSPDDIDPAFLDEEGRAELARWRRSADSTRENSRVLSTRQHYAYWIGRFERWCADPSLRRINRLPVVFNPWPVDLKTLEWFLEDFCEPPKDEDEAAEWVAPATKTIDNIVSALKWKMGQDDVRLKTTPAFDDFVKGLRNELHSVNTTRRAEPLRVEQLAVVGDFLLRRSPNELRDRLIVVCHGLGLGLAAITRLNRNQAARLVGDDRRHPTLRAHLSDLLTDPRLEGGLPSEPLFDTYPQQVRQVILRCSREAGLSNGKSSRQHSTEETVRMLEWLEAFTDPARLRDHALLTVGFGAALRRSELSRANISWIELKDDGFNYYVHFSKTNKTNMPERIGVPYGNHVTTDPDRALRIWLDYLGKQGRTHPTMPLFPAIDRHGNISDQHIGGDAIAEIIRKRVSESGVAATEEAVASYSGHSFRRGFCTSAAERGIDVLTIAKHTRHKNLDIVQEYVDAAESLDRTKNPAAQVLA